MIFFSALTQAEFRGRRLTREEATGYCNLAFSGGRHISPIARRLVPALVPERRPEPFSTKILTANTRNEVSSEWGDS